MPDVGGPGEDGSSNPGGGLITDVINDRRVSDSLLPFENIINIQIYRCIINDSILNLNKSERRANDARFTTRGLIYSASDDSEYHSRIFVDMHKAFHIVNH